ncbi:hypothetical protein [Vibrio algarum]|uniref:Uncharacterized protein n=1 Tax=Vibrio algarum TaxID=3020714 RepID=A0ABT4YSZ5_9VIBR|nr:hypothetical protein [Vibrio sp. KJ40-1]MDB1124685.1 hypothetical protein [Vibrio sp. KJ40-1]
MNSNKALDKIVLPNPFTELPQLSLSGMTSVTQALIAQSAVLSQGQTMMLHFFNDELELAYNASLNIDCSSPTLDRYRSLIHTRYNEAKSFDSLLDNLLN